MSTEDFYEEDPYAYEDDEASITAEDSWTVISAFFREKGLVSQQLDSFNQFINYTIQDSIMEDSTLILEQLAQHTTETDNISRKYEISFGKIYLAKPSMTESDGVSHAMYPQEARLRNLTYASGLFVEIRKRTYEAVDIPGRDLKYEVIDEESEMSDENKIFIGRVPIMLRSKYCLLDELTESDLYKLKECPFDMGGYFIINGSEKVLIAQERSAGNIVQVFKKSAPSPISHIAEIRSALEKGSRFISTLQVKLYGREGNTNRTIKATLPYIKQDIPIVIIFRSCLLYTSRCV